MAYKYSPLPDGRYFRLLRVVQIADGVTSGTSSTAAANSTSAGSASESDGRLSVELTTFPIDHSPPFWALSYTWGPPLFGPDGKEPDPAAPQPSRTVRCGGTAMQIGENLHDFLCLCRDKGLFKGDEDDAARSPDEAAEPFNPFPSSVPGSRQPKSLNWREGRAAYVWVDALCINQENLEERAQQVRLMGAIYKASKRVLAWLGRHRLSPESVWAFEIFVPSLFRNKNLLGGSTFELDDPKVVAAVGEGEVVRWRAAYPVLFNFFVQTRWFSRGWVVQEVLLKENTDDVTMLCGSGALRFKYFIRLTAMMSAYTRFDTNFELRRRLHLLDHEGSSEGSVKGSGRWKSGRSPLDALNTQRRVMGCIRVHLWPSDGGTRWQHVLKLIADMGYSSFNDPRDRVFGCLGLIDTIVPEADLSSMLPDYTVSITELFTSLACLLYENIYELEYILCLAGAGPTSMRGLPSWAPDFTRIGGIRTRLIGRNSSNLAGGMNASKLFPVPRLQAELNMNEKALVLDGVRLGVAGELVAMKKPRNFDAEWLLEYCDKDEVYPNGPMGETQNCPQAVILTLSINNARTAIQRQHAVAGRSFPGEAAGHIASTARDWYLRVLSISLKRGLISETSLAAKLVPAAARHPDWLPTPVEVQALAAEMTLNGDRHGRKALAALRLNPWDNHVRDLTEGRRLFLTDGGLLCLGPQEVESGDEIWIVRGSRIPLLLRKTEESGGSYRFIGETYVHGAMYGEAVTEEVEKQFAPVRLV